MNKLLVITGASKGIGLATAKHFRDNDYRVINLSRSPCEVAGVQNFTVDLLSPSWQDSMAAVLQSVGEPDQLVLVHNAAMMTKDTVREIEVDTLRTVLELNVVAAAKLNTLLLGRMKEGSSIVYIKR